MLIVNASKMKKLKAKTSTTTIISNSFIYFSKFNITDKNTKFFI